MTNKIVKIKNDTYGQTFWWVKAKSPKEFNNILKTVIPNLAEQMEMDESVAYGETIDLNYENKVVICFWFGENDFACMVHELLHATLICLRCRGLILSKDSEEAYCYLFDWLTTQILKKICKTKPIILASNKTTK